MDLTPIIDNAQSIGIFAAFLSVLIVVHEWGHFITAKKMGVKVERFSLGFGPKLFSWVKDGTEYLVCLIPMGGYVKMAGDERNNCKGEKDEFYSKPPGKRSLIILNGPVVNYALAYVALFFVFILGYPDLSTNISEVVADYPAQEAGLLAGDRVLEIDSQKMTMWGDIQEKISKTKKESLDFLVLRDGKEVNITVSPKVEQIKNIFGQAEEIRMAGIVPTEDVVLIKYGFVESFGQAAKKLWNVTSLTYRAIWYMATGAMSPKESMTGPIGIFFIVKAAAEMGISHLLYILGVISASLAIFNLLPFIPLDGGHLFLLGIEKIRGRALSDKVDDAIAKIGFSLIICLAIFVFYNDFSRFGWIENITQFLK